MAARGSSSTPQGFILTSNEYEQYRRLTRVVKSAPTASVAQNGNISAFISHSSGPWILDFGAFDHLSGIKDLFLLLTLPLRYPWVP